MNKKYILFDLDGTLTDSAEGIINCVKYALEPHGIELPLKTLNNFIGPPLVEAFMEYAGLSREEAENTVARYRERYSTVGLFENSLYDGVRDMLTEIHGSGKVIILATAKPLIFAERIIEHFGLSKYFHLLVGAELHGKIHNKIDVIGEVLRKENIPDVGEVIMIGDRHHDIEGAAHFGIESIGVTYGFGDRAELEKAGANYIVDTPKEISHLLLGN